MMEKAGLYHALQPRKKAKRKRDQSLKSAQRARFCIVNALPHILQIYNVQSV